jgi:hypothetical protein
VATATRTLAATSTTDVASPLLARLAGPLALAAGALFTVTQLVLFAMIAAIDRTDPHWLEVYYANPGALANSIAQFVAFCLLALALLAAYARQAHRAGALGVISVGVALVGTICIAGDAWFEAFAAPWIASVGPELFIKGPSGMLPIGAGVSLVLFALGWVLFGIASLRARIFPVAISIAIVVGGLAGFQALAMPPIGAILGLAVAWLGVWMLRTTTSTRKIAEPATASR